jgi:hypothetical protein
MKRHILFLWLIGYTVYSATTQLYAQSTTATTIASTNQSALISDYERRTMTVLERLGKKENYESIYRFMYKGMVERDSAMIQNNKILSSYEARIARHYPMPKAEIQRITWLLAYDGYSMEKIRELYEQYHINLLETRVFDAIMDAVCTRPLIVSAKVDTIYTDKSIEDGFITSIFLTITETIKGDTNIKKAIIRDYTGEMVVRGGQREFRPLSHSFLFLIEHQEYVICLGKSWYNWKRIQNLNNQSAQDNSIYYTTGRSTSISLIPEQDPEQEKARLGKIQQIRDLCKQLAGFFRSLKK